MKIVVTTPTGHVGSRVVQLLLQAGVRPTVLVRDPARLDPDVRELVEVRQGDQGDADFVREATEGADALFWVDPTDFGADDANAESRRLGRIAAAAVRHNKIPQTIFQSSVGAEKRHGAGLIDGLAEIEQLLNDTDGGVLILRCGYFFTNLLTAVDALRAGVLTTTMPPEAPMPWVDPRDIGEVVAARLLSTQWSGHQVQAVHGPTDLSYTQVVDILTEACGRPISVQEQSDEQSCKDLLAAWMSETTADGVVAMTSGLRDGFVPEQPRSAISTTPTTLGQWAYQYLRPALTDPATDQ
ncbi:MAG: NAD(P)H-binding protein [Nakamurella sp.]